MSLWFLLVLAQTTPLVEVKSVIADAVVDLRYATPDNFMKQQVYPTGARCLLHHQALERLNKAATVLRQQGFRLLLYDCYRPRSVQFALWKAFPKPGFVADPRLGSVHSRGGAVDVSLVTADGERVEMPTPYDSFTKEAHHGYRRLPQAALDNRERLKRAMLAAGFTLNPSEWWHYDAQGSKGWPLLDVPVTGDSPTTPK
jgi:zinc D-Ala-D-Ala dipeptidase